MSVPIATSPGRAGFGPQLSLSYDSGAGNGPFGFGWSLSLPQITRKTDKGLPQYHDAEESDVFILSSAEDLVPLLNADGTRFKDAATTPGYTVHRYRPRIEGLFARIERWTRDADGDVHWRSISKENILTLYGKDSNSRITDSDDPLRVFTWLICETRDDKGNAVLYEYKPEDGNGVGLDLTRPHERNRGDRNDPRRATNRYLKHIHYGNRVSLLDDAGQRPRFLPIPPLPDMRWMFEVVFDYGEHDINAPKPDDAGQWNYRSDPFSSYRAGFEVRTGRLCQRVLMFHHFPGEAGVGRDCLVRSTDFTYSHEQDPASARNPVYTFLREVTQTSYKRQNGGYLKRSLPPVEYEYIQPIVQDVVQEVGAESLENLPIGADGAAYQWTDLHGEGIPGILTEQTDAWFYKRNISPISSRPVEFASSARVAMKPNLALAGGQAQFMDLAGDGQPDLVVLDGPAPGLFEHNDKEGWQSFRPFTSRLNRDPRNPNLKFVDLDGDGHADVLISENDAFVWHASRGEGGFGPARPILKTEDEEDGPRIVFADGTQSIYLADLSGDGLTDLVRIRNGETCYWPNLGYGRFGAKVTMDHAPYFDNPDQFDSERIRLADIDGTGTTDIIYLHRDGVRLYFNHSGNSWSEPRQLNVFPRVDDLVAIVATDLLGNGTACLVWSSSLPGDTQRQMRYVDLMGGQKPHLLTKVINNLGAETVVHYAPSTKFYLQDRQDGRPWITRLPFPVHVVERVETHDHISRNRFVTRYAYHHGYFDGEEREFRGFGMVEQWDTETFGSFTEAGTLAAATNLDSASHVPPTLTRTWFHTGAYLGRDHVSDFFAGFLNSHDEGEYYREPELTDAEARASLLPDTVLPSGLTLEEEREAVRALKGSMLRQETYALDGTSKEEYPYTVVEQNFSVRLEQPRGANRHGVFFTQPREAITYHYERNPADPRVQHALTLEVDPFGNVLKEAAIAYGRRQPDFSLPLPIDRDKQTRKLITYTEHRVTNPIDVGVPDAYRTPLLCETRTYELTGYTPTGPAARFQSSDFVQLAGAALVHSFDTEINYDDLPTAGKQRRLIEHVRSLFRRDDLAGPLPLGELQSLALPFQNYQLAFTPGLVAGAYGPRVTSAMLETEAGYVHSEGDANWWIPDNRVFFSPTSNDPAPQELAYARSHFFLPHRTRDPFHTDAISTEITITYDAYDLLMLESRDPLGNRVTVGERLPSGDPDATRAGNDYRVLQPWRVTDPNGNRTQVAFDLLGMVVGTAVMGKDDTVGDTLSGFEPELTQAQIDEFSDSADPHGPAFTLLQGATTRLIYDLDRFRLSRLANPADPSQWLPAYTATLARETHVSDPLPPQGLKIQLSFSFSDGFGREIQRKIQAEPGSLIAGGPVVNPRWVGSGWTIFNNKGKPVRQYEPFFSATQRFEFGVQTGVSSILFYDPAGRVVATLHPNHTYQKMVFDPWRQVTWDVNDTVLDDPRTDADIGGITAGYFGALPTSPPAPPWQTWHAQRQGGALGAQEQAAASNAAAHAGTPTTAHFDALGRPFLTLSDNGTDPIQPSQHLLFATRVELDIEGNQRAVTDALGRTVMQYDHNLLGTVIHQISMDAGERWMLADVAGKSLRRWDSRAQVFTTAYDALRRPTHLFVRVGDAPAALMERTVYGEAHPDSNPAAPGLAAPCNLNLRGRVFISVDQAGLVTSGAQNPETNAVEAYDFKGNLLRSVRQFAREYKRQLDWSEFDPLFTPAPGTVLQLESIGVALAPALEAETFTQSSTFDALNRPSSSTAPDGSVVRPVFNDANLLEGVTANLRGTGEATDFIRGIEYDAKGQRKEIVYGNNVVTAYDYDPQTFRLTRLRTTRGQTALQDLSYIYDPAGNITTIGDDAQQTIFFNNQIVSANSFYTYDALYRLTRAEGREHSGQNAAPQVDHDDSPRMGLPLPHPNDAQAMRRYVEEYEYDEVGNILRMIHRAGGADWTRRYQYASDSNRLLHTSLPGDADGGPFSAGYEYDAHGNMVRMPHLPSMRWDSEDQLASTQRQVVNNGTPETTYYVYNAAGQRVRKVTERDAAPDSEPARKNERFYLGGFEVYREYGDSGATVRLERQTLNVMDDKRRVAVVDTKTIDASSPNPLTETLIRFQLDNHLGSASLELDGEGAVISYEEYHPYGSTSYQAGRSAVEVSLKRYRYTGKERDEETGLNYHGARYYAPWLGRWTAADPAELVDGVNRYAYAKGDPVGKVDPRGTQSYDPNAPIGMDALDAAMAREQSKAAEAIRDKPAKVKINDVVLYSKPLTDRANIGVNPQKDHVIAQGKQKLINPRIDASKQLTVVQETGAAKGGAPAKPHTIATFHDPQADVKEIKRLRGLKPEGFTSFEQEIVSPSLHSRYRAGYLPSSTNTALLDEIGSMFEVDQPSRATSSRPPASSSIRQPAETVGQLRASASKFAWGVARFGLTTAPLMGAETHDEVAEEGAKGVAAAGAARAVAAAATTVAGAAALLIGGTLYIGATAPPDSPENWTGGGHGSGRPY